MKTCPIIDTFNLLGKKWSLCILHTIKNENEPTFTKISKVLKLNPRTLSTRLTDLELNKIVKNKNKLYILTQKGIDLMESFATLDDWNKKYN